MNRKSLVVSLCVLAVAAACGGGSGDGSSLPPGSSNPLPPGPGDNSSDPAGDGGTTSGYQRPYQLTPLSPPRTNTANISLFFSVVDKTGVGVAELVKDVKAKDVFDAFEDGAPIDPLESFFDVQPLSGQHVTIPTVLLLDLSGSVVNGGALTTLKKAASTIIDTLLPEQRLAILSFADNVNVRAQFSTDKAALKKAVDNITSADGLSTNLYGAMVQGLGMWQDGFVGGLGGGQLTAGLAIVITDGADTAGLAKLDAVIKARANKRVVAVGVGSEINTAAMESMASTGTFVKSTSFEDLDANLTSLATRLGSLNKSIYQANYCSPKRAGSHNLLFTVKGNGASVEASCKPALFTNPCSIAGAPEYTENCGQAGSSSVCCAANTPYHCAATNTCFPTAEAAAKACGDSCTRCGGSGQPNQTTFEGGTAIRVTFAANGYQSQQCPPFYGPECKATLACCDKLPGQVKTQCTGQIDNAGGNESTCGNTKAQYCKTLGPECTKTVACCGTFGNNLSVQCWNQAQGTEAACTQYLATFCAPAGPNCASLRTCCAAMVGDTRTDCDTRYSNANGNEAQCLSLKPAGCN